VLAKAVVAFLAGRYKSVSVCIFLILPILALAGCGHSQTAFKLPDPKVLVALPVQQHVKVHNEWLAPLDGYPNAEIRPQRSRYIVSQDYRQVAVVRNDQVFFAIDPPPFQANLECAKGEIAQGRLYTFAGSLPHPRRYDHRGRTGWLGNPRMCSSLKMMIATMLRCVARSTAVR